MGRRTRFGFSLLGGAALLAALTGGPTGLSARAAGTDRFGRETQSSAHPPAPAVPPPPRLRFLEAWRAPLTSAIAGPLLVGHGAVFVALETGAVIALSPDDGKTLWRTELPGPARVGPVGVGDAILQATEEGHLLALEPGDGKVRWDAPLGDRLSAAPTGAGDRILVPLASARLMVLSADGTERWRGDLQGWPSVPPAACRGFVVVGTEAGTVEAFTREEGRRLWTARTESPIRSPLLCYRGRIYFTTADGGLRALKYSGRRQWSFPSGASMGARPFGAGNRVYFLSYDNDIYVLDADSGHLIQRTRLSHRLADDPCVDRERVYLSPRTSGKLQSLGLPDLAPQGEFSLELEGEWFTTPPVRAGERILIGYGRYEGRVLALREEEAPATP